MARIVVLGSLNMDLVVRVDHIPAPGETILGSGFQMLPGGKGANQAYAAARLSQGGVAMIGRVGNDVFGQALLASLASAGVDTMQVLPVLSAATGIATITVDRNGQNSIVVASGANFDWDGGQPPAFGGASFALFQLETPLAVVLSALRRARRSGAMTILDPAPAQLLTAELLKEVDLLTPNESEALILLGQSPREIVVEEAPALARQLHAIGARQVILKLGGKGSFYSSGSESIHVPAIAVTAVDTTAAGDTFNGALAVALAEGRNMAEAMRFANIAAAISVTRSGAQASMPSRAEVDALV